MNEIDHAELARRVEVAEQKIAELEQRLAAVELRPAARTDPWTVTEAQATAPQEGDAPASERGATILALIGRTFLILSGAFLVRAATDAQMIPHAAGVAIGLTYGAFWLVLASRRSETLPREATFFALSTALICFPLLFEATLKMGILPPVLTLLLLMGVWAGGVGVAYRARLRGAAWLFSVGAGTTGLALCFRGGFWIPYSFAVLAMALSGLWLGYLRGWRGLAVVGTAVANAVVVALSLLRVVQPVGIDLTHLHPLPLLALQLGLVALFMGSYLVRALFLDAHVSDSDILQAVTAMFLGFVGALHTGSEIAGGAVIVGLFAAITALFGYAVTFRYMDMGQDSRRNFGFFTSAALASALIGTTHLVHGVALTLVLCAASLALIYAGTRAERATLSLHGAIYAAAAAFSSGLFFFSLRALVGDPETLPAPETLVWMGLVLLCAVASFWARVTDAGRTWGKWSRSPKFLSAAVLVLGLLGLAAGAVGQWVMPNVHDAWQSAIFGAWRTGSLAVAAIAVALIGRVPRLREAHLLLPILLGAGSISLLLGDLRAGRPATLMISLLLFGSALMFAPRLRARARPSDEIEA